MGGRWWCVSLGGQQLREEGKLKTASALAPIGDWTTSRFHVVKLHKTTAQSQDANHDELGERCSWMAVGRWT